MSRPWYRCGDNTVLRAADARRICLNIYDIGIPITGAPSSKTSSSVVRWRLLSADAATALMPSGWMNPDGKGAIRIKKYIIDRSVLDIQYFFEYCFSEHTLPLY